MVKNTMSENNAKIDSSLRSIKKRVSGAMWIFNPAGSSYKDPKTGEVVVRTESSLQYAKSGIPQKWSFGKIDIDNVMLLLNSKEFASFKDSLPEESTLEPNSY